MIAIYKKELRSYFTSMIGYVFIAFLLVVIGIYFSMINLIYGNANFENTLSQAIFVFIILMPVLTMRLMAEENKQKTDQLLYTSPLSATAIAMGKFLAVFTVFLIAMGITCFYPLIMANYGKVPMDSAYSGILAFLLMGAAYLAIGLYISSLTESQVVAAVISFVVFLLTIIIDSLANGIPSDSKTAFVIFSILLLIICVVLYRLMRNLTIAVGAGVIGEAALVAIYMMKPSLLNGLVAKVFKWFSLTSRFDTFVSGIFDVAGIIYFISITALFVFLTTQVIKKKRWS